MASFDEVVPPGKAGSIKASIHTTNFRGSIGKSITVTHDDPSQGPVTITALARVVGSVDVFPFPALQIGGTRRGFETPATLIVRKDPTEQGSLAFSGLSASAPWMKVTTRRVTTDEPAVEGLPAAVPGDIVLSVLAQGAPVGNSIETISFQTGLGREPTVTIPVTVSVQPLITFQPNDLTLDPVPDGSGKATGQVLAALREDLDPKTVTAVSDAEAFTVRLEPPGERAFRVIVEWSGKGQAPPLGTIIHIRVGSQNADLPVRVNLARAAAAP